MDLPNEEFGLLQLKIDQLKEAEKVKIKQMTLKVTIFRVKNTFSLLQMMFSSSDR